MCGVTNCVSGMPLTKPSCRLLDQHIRPVSSHDPRSVGHFVHDDTTAIAGLCVALPRMAFSGRLGHAHTAVNE